MSTAKKLPLLARGNDRGRIDFREVERLEPVDGKQTLVWHPHVPVALNISGTGKKSWVLATRVQGKSRRLHIADYGTAEDELMARARLYLDQARLGLDPMEEARRAVQEEEAARPDRVTLSELRDRYLLVRGDRLKPRSKELYHKGPWAKHSQDWLGRDIGSIRPAEIAERYGELLAKLAPGTVNAWASGMRSLFNFASDMELISARSPVDVLRKQRLYVASGVRSNIIPSERLPDWFGAVRKMQSWGEFPKGEILEFALLSAARRDEIVGMTWSELDLDRGVWTIPAARTKSSRERIIPLTHRMSELVEVARNADLGSGTGFGVGRVRSRVRSSEAQRKRLVFATVNSQSEKQSKFDDFTRLVNRVKLLTSKTEAVDGIEVEGVYASMHDCRRSWSSLAAVTEGVPEVCRLAILGHSQIGVTGQHYTVLEEGVLRRSLQRVEDRILGMALPPFS